MDSSEPSQHAGRLRSATREHAIPVMEDEDLDSLRLRMMTLTLSALSRRADDLLNAHWQTLFDIGLAMKFNNATLATKYWTLALPHHRTSVSTIRHALSGDISGGNLELLQASSQLGHDTLDHLTESVTTATLDTRR